MTNPLLAKSNLKYGAVPFDKIETDHYLPSIEAAIALAKKNVEAIKTNSDEPTFENTTLALEYASEMVSYSAGAYGNVKHAHGDEKMHKLAGTIMPMLSKYSNDINLDDKLFEKIKVIYNKRDSSGFSVEQIKLVEDGYKDFTRNGALLSPEDKEKLRNLDEELSTLSPKFSENVLKSTNAYELVLTDKEDLVGLPDSAIEAAALAAKERGKEGNWLFTLQFPSVVPFLKYADNRDLREGISLAFQSRAMKGETANHEYVKKIASLRHERANLLGYDTHAHFELEERMAQKPEKVMAFLNELTEASLPAAKRELEELVSLKKEMSGDDDFQSWDGAYYVNKLQEKKFDFDPEVLRPYFKLENVLEGVFEHARKLFGLVFVENKELPVYHEDVMLYEAKDEKSGEFMGLFYADFFPRDTKQAGAWCTRYKSQGLESGEMVRPHVSIVCNFTKPTESKPSLLTLGEVTTLFHEFGHALHSLLSKCTYKSLSCTNVFRDFVELPSQILENWVKEKEGLDIFAKHYETGESIPEEYIKKIKETAQFNAASLMLRQLNFGILDMSWYGSDPRKVEDVVKFEDDVTASTQLIPKPEGTGISCSFSHIFAGGYSAGYYSYKWAEVLDADAFEYFKESGIFNKDVADKFNEHVLSKGGTEHPMELYKKFRGREPDSKALLRRDGLI